MAAATAVIFLPPNKLIPMGAVIVASAPIACILIEPVELICNPVLFGPSFKEYVVLGGVVPTDILFPKIFSSFIPPTQEKYFPGAIVANPPFS